MLRIEGSVFRLLWSLAGGVLVSLRVSSSACRSPFLHMGTMRVEFNSSGRRLHLGQGIGAKSWGLCV